jgi:hypothetical protein
VGVKPTDPIIEAAGEVRKGGARSPEERLYFRGDQLQPEHHAGAAWILEEVPPEGGVGKQPPQGPLHIALTHAVLRKHRCVSAFLLVYSTMIDMSAPLNATSLPPY